MGKADTRRRIVEATVELHEDVGPAATTITAIAKRAGVQRLTVYRHFPDDEALVTACSAHWTERHPIPDPSRWLGIEDPRRRLEEALGAIYGYYRDGARMVERVLRDEEDMPELAQVLAPWHEYMREVAGGLAAGWGTDTHRQRIVRSAVAHTLDFFAWRSLAAQGLSDEEAGELMVGLVADVATGLAHGAKRDSSCEASG